MAIAKAKCTCLGCGKEFIVTAEKRNRAEADSFEAWARKNCDICKDCMKSQRDSEIAAQAEILGFATLKGTEKQVKWANDIRNTMYFALKETLDMYAKHAENAEHIETVYKYFKAIDTAKWFIDNRDELHIANKIIRQALHM